MRHAFVVCLVLATGCTKKDEWGGQAIGSCVGPLADGTTVCLDRQSEVQCTNAGTTERVFMYMEHTSCANHGYAAECPEHPGMRLKDCAGAAAPTAADEAGLEAARQVLAIYDAAAAAADEAPGDCTAFTAKLAPLRDQLETIGTAHPHVLNTLSTEQMQELDAVAKMEAISSKLHACPTAKEFAFAMTKVM